MSLAGEFHELADELLREFGRRDYVFHTGAETYDPTTGQTTFAAGSETIQGSPLVQKRAFNRPADTALAADGYVYAAARSFGVAPFVGQKITVGAGGPAWSVLAVTTHAVQSSDIVYELAIRKGAR